MHPSQPLVVEGEHLSPQETLKEPPGRLPLDDLADLRAPGDLVVELETNLRKVEAY